MKNDINLIYKRKNVKSSQKMTIGILAGAVLLVVFIIAGIWLPLKTKADAQENLNSINQQIQAYQLSDADILTTTMEYQQLTEHLTKLTLIQESRSDVLNYLKSIENALPTGARLTNISMLDNLLTMTGEATDDTEIAAFMLHLKKSGLFIYLLLDSSTVSDNGHNTLFSLSAILPVSLSGPAVSEEVSDDELSNSENVAEQQTKEVSP